jgi:hypothetical protein
VLHPSITQTGLGPIFLLRASRRFGTGAAQRRRLIQVRPDPAVQRPDRLSCQAWDLAHTPTPDIRVQACGDAHLLNFGMYAAPDRRLVFDVNDFDETLPAPFEWDVKRLAASFAVAARDNGFKDRDAHTAARLAVRSYRTEMAGYAAMHFLEVWYSRIDIDEVSRVFDALQSKAAVRRRHRDIAKPRARPSSTITYASCAT